MNDLVLRFAGNGTLIDFKGHAASDLFELTDESLGKNIHDIMPQDISKPIMSHVEKTLNTGDPQSFEYQPIWMDEWHYELRFVIAGGDEVFVIVSNISDYRRTEEKLKHLAYHDALTDLPNRYMFSDRLEQEVFRAERKKQLLAVLFLDIDNFKQINDTIGHKAGDNLLQSIAKRLLAGMRRSDSISRMSAEGSDHVVARLGGDEFVVLLSDIKTAQDPAIVAKRILNMLSEPFIIYSKEVFITASVGIAVYPADGKEIDTLLMNADVAMYQAKQNGRNNYQYYSESMNILTIKRFTIENKLRKALENNEFMLFYQPQIDISTGKIIGAEALIRWLQPDLVLVKAGEFVPLAEETGLIIPIGEWVLRTACQESMVWQKAGLKPMRVTVNVSSVQFRQDNFVERVSHILSDTGLNPQYLQLELTESVIMRDAETTINKLHSLQAMGIQIAIDDFGTGYSSLNYLKRLPLSTLKIDYSFIKDLVSNPNDQAIVNTVVSLAHNFNLNVIAEGVEEDGQLSLLRDFGCEGVQGFLICPPVNPAILAEFVKKKKYLEILKKLSRKA